MARATTASRVNPDETAANTRSSAAATGSAASGSASVAWQGTRPFSNSVRATYT